MASSNAGDNGATDESGGDFVFVDEPAERESGGKLRDFFFGERDAGSDGGSEAPKRRGRKPGSTNKPRTFDAPSSLDDSEPRDIGADVRDGIKAASKSAQKLFGPQLGQVWELDRTEVALLASPATRLIKQTSSTTAAASPKWTALMLAGIAALIGLPRVMITMQYMKFQRAQLAAQQGQTQSTGPVQASQQTQPQKQTVAHGFDPIADMFPSD